MYNGCIVDRPIITSPGFKRGMQRLTCNSMGDIDLVLSETSPGDEALGGGNAQDIGVSILGESPKWSVYSGKSR